MDGITVPDDASGIDDSPALSESVLEAEAAKAVEGGVFGLQFSTEEAVEAFRAAKHPEVIGDRDAQDRLVGWKLTPEAFAEVSGERVALGIQLLIQTGVVSPHEVVAMGLAFVFGGIQTGQLERAV